MKTMRILIFIFLLPLFVSAQKEHSKIYTKAIAEYLKAVSKTDNIAFDTLYVGPVGEDFKESIKDIKLPKEILNKKISKLTQKEGERKAVYRKTFVFVNIIGNISKDRAEFIFVTFIVEHSPIKTNWWPKHNSYYNFKFDTQKKDFVIEKQRFEYIYSNKFTEKKQN